ncbi:MAG TPA: VCBS repeat-containing protein, partial [Acidimicrobiales bacterium]
SGCWGAHTLIEAHELVHTLGSVQPGAPNATAQGHCSDEYDRMCYADAQGVNMRIVCPSTAYENRLDCNGDDYFSTSPAPGSWLATHWNTANSSFLAAGSAATQPPRAQRNDFDGDGKTDVAVYRPAGAQWLIKDGSPGFHQWGTDGDLAVPADYTGDGKVDVATFRPSVGQWFVKDVPSGFVIWGQNGDIPVPADYDGDGKADIAVFRPTTGGWFVQGVGLTLWGAEGDVPVPGDYDGDGDADRAVYRPSTGAWFVHGSLAVTWWGTSGDIPVPGDYDGNGTLDKAVFRPSTGSWLVNGGSAGPTVWGGSQDVPTVVSNTVFGVLGLLHLIV